MITMYFPLNGMNKLKLKLKLKMNKEVTQRLNDIKNETVTYFVTYQRSPSDVSVNIRFSTVTS